MKYCVNFLRAMFFLGAVMFSARVLHAECVPSDDPCAPKKKVGEWDLSGLIGFNLTQGNSDTLLITTGFKAALDQAPNVWDIGLDYSYGEDSDKDDEENGDTTRNDFRAYARYDRLLNERFYLGLGSAFLYDEIAEVDYRVNVNPNLGYYLLRDNTFKLRVEGGPSYVFEKVDDEEDDYFSPRVAQRFDWAISCTSKIYEQAEVLFDATDSDNYLVNAEIGVEAALATNLALVFTVRETYDNQPAEARDKDDLAVISALKVTL